MFCHVSVCVVCVVCVLCCVCLLCTGPGRAWAPEHNRDARSGRNEPVYYARRPSDLFRPLVTLWLSSFVVRCSFFRCSFFRCRCILVVVTCCRCSWSLSWCLSLSLSSAYGSSSSSSGVEPPHRATTRSRTHGTDTNIANSELAITNIFFFPTKSCVNLFPHSV